MPLNVRRFYVSILLILSFSFLISAQTPTPTVAISTPVAAAPVASAADVMRDRVTKAKAYIAVKNFNAAIYELENIRRETSDATVHGVINVLLMNSYLEQGDYKRAQDFLKELSNPQKNKNNSAGYFAAAGQVVKGARTQLERYKSLGLSVSDRNLPVEAATDVQKMRETLEMIAGQSKVLGVDKKQTADAMALLEEATNARTNLAKDDYDAKRWKNEVADAREALANSRSVIINAAGEPTTIETPKNDAAIASNVSASTTQNSTAAPQPTENSPIFQPLPTPANESLKQTPVKNDVSQTPTETVAKVEKKTEDAPKTFAETAAENALLRNRRVENPNTETAANQKETNPAPAANSNNTDAPKDNSPLKIGSLVEYATQKTSPVYPPTAKTMRMTGVVRVDVTIDEDGKVAEVQNTSGPTMLQRAASDAIRKWKFKPFVRDGEPVKATGFVSFNFSL